MDLADVIRLKHMRDSTAEALQFAAGKIRADLDHDRMLILAILKDLEIIGEAASRVSRAVKQDNPSVPWDEITGMRNRLPDKFTVVCRPRYDWSPQNGCSIRGSSVLVDSGFC